MVVRCLRGVVRNDTVRSCVRGQLLRTKTPAFLWALDAAFGTQFEVALKRLRTCQKGSVAEAGVIDLYSSGNLW
jgi:hypothetical protein